MIYLIELVKNNMRVFTTITLYCFSLLMGLNSYCQNKDNFYDKETTLADLKQSISKALDVYPRNMVVGAKNFRVLLSNDYFDSTLFYSALDTLSKYDSGKFSSYYIIITLGERNETSTGRIFIRGYSKCRGKDVHYYLFPEHFRDGIFISDYSHNKRIFKDAYKMEVDEGLPESSSLLSISVFTNGSFKSKIFQANNLTPEYFERIDALLGDDW
jgi:hypothetical protein